MPKNEILGYLLHYWVGGFELALPDADLPVPLASDSSCSAYVWLHVIDILHQLQQCDEMKLDQLHVLTVNFEFVV